MIRVVGLDHIVLNVADVDRSLAFYCDLLGLQPERVEPFHAGQVPFPSVRITETTIIDLFPSSGDTTESPGERRENLNHFCLVLDAEDLAEVRRRLTEAGYPPMHEPTTRWGAQGNALSLYLKDPDGNTLELRTYRGHTGAE